MPDPAQDSVQAMKALTDEQLVSQTRLLVQLERQLTASSLVHLGELAARGLSWPVQCRAGAPSSGDEGSRQRTRAARVLRDFPDVLEMFERAELDLATIDVLADVLTAENRSVVLEHVRGRSAREIRQLLRDASWVEQSRGISSADVRDGAPAGLQRSSVSNASR